MKYPTDASFMIGDRIRFKRKQLNMTQKDLASSIGVTFQQLQKYESGQSNVSIIMLIKLCKVLDVDVTYFISNHECQNISMHDNLQYIDRYPEENLEKRLLEIFKLIDNKQLQKSILNLIESIISTK